MIRHVAWKLRDEPPICDCGCKYTVRQAIVISWGNSKHAYRCSRCKKMIYIYAHKRKAA